jgi:hypothetical protein
MSFGGKPGRRPEFPNFLASARPRQVMIELHLQPFAVGFVCYSSQSFSHGKLDALLALSRSQSVCLDSTPSLLAKSFLRSGLMSSAKY